MVSTLARILDVAFKRIQFTPDLMPSDITGTNVLEEDEHGKHQHRRLEGVAPLGDQAHDKRREGAAAEVDDEDEDDEDDSLRLSDLFEEISMK